jgi:hypothetical protein
LVGGALSCSGVVVDCLLGGGEASFDFHSHRFWWTLGMDSRPGRNP